MAVEIRFDANQQYQLDAIASVVDLFAGQEGLGQGLATSGPKAVAGGGLFDQVVFGNSLDIAPSTIKTNLRRVQDRPVVRSDGSETPSIAADLRADVSEDSDALDFSVEMETGTGKTYVYLRTIAELNKAYGYTKFVIVVPSVAIREGVLSSLDLLADHIRDLYDGLQVDSYVWNSKPTTARNFGIASHVQIMVITIDAFTKESNVMNKQTEYGYAPIEYIQACRPIVIMDEPQNMETPTRQQAIASLSPLFKLRYSATHKDLKHLVYRLTPVDAYDHSPRLVKRIGVLSIVKDEDPNEAAVDVLKVTGTAAAVTATARINRATAQGTKLTQVTLRKDDDLHDLSGGLSAYAGWSVEDIHVGMDGQPGWIEFGNGTRIREGGDRTNSEQLQRLMIRQAVESHFEKELQLVRQLRRGVIEARLKPLTLFFIDKVANYHPAGAKFRTWFEDEYEFVRNNPKYRAIKTQMPDVKDVHDGYFATTSKGEPKDLSFTATGAETKDAEGAFERIMRGKEKLLSCDEPLRFIFSHSALVEGWDNPNVFTICNLQDGRSTLRKRQQIGRGLRLPVMDNGERCRVDDVNLLTVIAYEDFATFAKDLQEEIETDTGTTFTGRIVNVAKDKTTLRLKQAVLDDPIFQELWARISAKTTYRIDFDTDKVVAESVRRINEMEPLEQVKYRISKAEIDITVAGVSGAEVTERGTVEVEGARRVPDVVGELTRRLPLSRATIVRILTEIDDLDQVRANPAAFIDQVESAISRALYDQVADGIVYTPTGESWSASLFKERHQFETVARADFVVPVTKSVTDKIVCDSGVEVAFAKYLEHERDDVPLFVKLPEWFKISIPLGVNYNPDWAIVRREPEGTYLYLVRETKGTGQIDQLQWESEGWKIKFGEAHFSAIKVDFMFGDGRHGNILVEQSEDFPKHTRAVRH
ncbi:hypothetical protein FB00_13510 [Cellulosimicrobium funkei]|uniref:Uncharacterized protein n=1 Tax=Cellulosimicrobium funkei TaxID=264251 RepID=A0A0H2KKU6_9MICO|nr:DEAD/DEAH box helicase family protein [Cellulosimicrobium funkei]KLN34190.1 hypothetical protein FB00_13510 [Cellulosimicrobium funkei]